MVFSMLIKLRAKIGWVGIGWAISGLGGNGERADMPFDAAPMAADLLLQYHNPQEN